MEYTLFYGFPLFIHNRGVVRAESRDGRFSPWDGAFRAGKCRAGMRLFIRLFGHGKALKNNRLKGWHVASLHEEAARSGSASSVTCASPASGSHPCSARYLFTYVQGSGETSRRRRSMG